MSASISLDDEEEVKGLLRRASDGDGDNTALKRLGNGKPSRQQRRSANGNGSTLSSLFLLMAGATIVGYLAGKVVFPSANVTDSLEIPTMQHAGKEAKEDFYSYNQQLKEKKKHPQHPSTPARQATTKATTTTITTTSTTEATTTTTTTTTTQATAQSAATMTTITDERDGDGGNGSSDEEDSIDDYQEEDSDPVKYYMSVRTDRSGSALCGYLLLHSYAFATNNTYGGACWDAIDWEPYIKKHGENFKKKVEERFQDVQTLTKLLGLEHELPYACPSDKDLESGKAMFFKKRGQYKIPGYTVEWLRHVQAKSTFQYAPPRGPNDPIDVVMHVRRGDFTPCHVTDRYLSNSYYLKVMEKYLPPLCDNHEPGCKITVYTEEETWESFEPFTNWPNLTFDYDSSLEDIWAHFMNADVFIMSKSSFSQVPAMMNRGTNVISPYVVGEFGMEEDIPTWIKVDPDILSEAVEYSNNISETVCTPDDVRGRYTSYYKAHPDEKLPGKE